MGDASVYVEETDLVAEEDSPAHGLCIVVYWIRFNSADIPEAETAGDGHTENDQSLE